jgi:hypothetical protein
MPNAVGQFVRISTATSSSGQVSITLQGNIEASYLEIISLPSNTKLARLTDTNYKGTLSEDSLANLTVDLRSFEPRFFIDKPPATDNRLIIQGMRNGESFDIMDAQITSLANVTLESAFLVEPDSGGGGFRHCGCCGIGCDPSANCINCANSRFTLCCPSGQIVCGWCNCPCPY